MHEIIPILSKREEARRMELAQKTKSALFLKSVSPLLNYVAVPTSIVPRTVHMLRASKESFARQERSLVYAGKIAFTEGTATYIDPDTGKTMNVPNHPAVLRELNRCGFKILPAKKFSFDDGNEIEDRDLVQNQRAFMGEDLFDEIQNFEAKLGEHKIGEGVCSQALCISYAINLTNEMQSTGERPTASERQIMEFGFNGFNYRNECNNNDTLQKFVLHALNNSEYLEDRYLQIEACQTEQTPEE